MGEDSTRICPVESPMVLFSAKTIAKQLIEKLKRKKRGEAGGGVAHEKPAAHVHTYARAHPTVLGVCA